jgi:hypothetical protein
VSTCTSFFCGQYEAPEARPWVFMHCVVGICVIHYSIAISQEILYTAGSIADANQRLPTLFYIRAGNAQTAVNVMVSIINFVFLPTIGAVCDYTRFRYHMGSAALCLVCITEFVSAAPSQNVIICFNCRIHLWFTTFLCLLTGILAHDDKRHSFWIGVPDLVHVLARRIRHGNVANKGFGPAPNMCPHHKPFHHPFPRLPKHNFTTCARARDTIRGSHTPRPRRRGSSA